MIKFIYNIIFNLGGGYCLDIHFEEKFSKVTEYQWKKMFGWKLCLGVKAGECGEWLSHLVLFLVCYQCTINNGTKFGAFLFSSSIFSTGRANTIALKHGAFVLWCIWQNTNMNFWKIYIDITVNLLSNLLPFANNLR